MRIVAVADTHTFTEDLRVPDGDVFVHAGDMGRGGELEELQRVAAWLRSLPHRHKVVVAGNHDWSLAPCTQRETLCRACIARGLHRCDPSSVERGRDLFADMIYLQDERVVVDGLAFYGSPWQPEFGGWAFNLRRGAALAEKWALIPDSIDVLITHGPPMDIGDRSPMGGRAGCADLRARVAEVRPRLHLFGHIHQDGGVWQHGATTFANVTTWECERQPTVIDIDASTVSAIEVPPHGRRDDE